MKALVKKYETVNELTYVEVGDKVMYYNEVGYEILGIVLEIYLKSGDVLLVIDHEQYNNGLELSCKLVTQCYSENEMTKEQYEQALVHFNFSRRTSKLPGHVRTTLSDGSDAHFLEVSYIDDTDKENSSYSAILRDLLSAREWENQQL